MTSKAGPKKTVGVIPDTWEIKPLGELAEIRYGLSGSLDRDLKEGVPIIALPNVSIKSRLCLKDHPMAHPSRVSQRHLLKRGDILFNWRNGSRKHLGKSAFISEGGRFTHVSFFLRIRVNGSVNPEYLYHYLRFVKENGYFMNARFHVNRTFNKKELAQLPTVLPSMKEQDFIASALCRWDQVVDRLEQAFQEVAELKLGILANIFSGRRRGSAFRRQDWTMVRLSDFVERVKDKLRPRPGDPERNCIGMENLESGTGRLLGVGKIDDRSSVRFKYKKGDVLFGRLRPYLRKFHVPDKDGFCSSEFWVLRPDKELCHEHYLYYLVQSPPFMRYASHGDGSSLPRANWDYVADVLFPLPSLEEQLFMVRCLSLADRQIETRRLYLEKIYLQKAWVRLNIISGKKRIRALGYQAPSI